MTPHLREVHDTDPAPGGNGHGDGYPCAVHAAELQEGRKVMAELRDAVKILSGRLDDEADSRAKRDNDVEEAIVNQIAATAALTKQIQNLVTVIGEPPDPSTGTPGHGMRGQIAVGINSAIRAGIRKELPSLNADDPESEITGVMDRNTLVVTKRAAEYDAAMARETVRTARIKAWGGVAIGIIGALAAAGVALLPHIIKIFGG